jgi:PAS domain S-box-containing protein
VTELARSNGWGSDRESRLAAIVESAEDAIIGKTLDGTITSWNAGAERIYGWSADEVVGRSINLLVAPGNTDEVPRILERLRRGERIHHLTTTRVCKDGSMVHVELTVSPVRDESGALVGASTIARDVGDRWRADEELAAREARAHAGIEAALDCIVTIDLEGRIVAFNSAAERTFGYAREDVIGDKMVDVIVPPARREDHRRGFARHLATGESSIMGRRIEVEGLRADGSEFPAELTIVRTDLPEPGFTAYLRDITERREAEQAMRRLAAIVESSEDAIVALAFEGRIISWNPAAERVYGYSAEEAIGAGAELVVPPEFREELRAALSAVKRGERVDRFDTVRVTRDGRRLDVSMTISPLHGVGHGIVGASLIHRDITERKRGEEALLRLAAIIEGSDDAIVGRDLDGIVTSWNAGAERLFGWNAEEMIGRSIDVLIPDDDPQKYIRSLSNRLRLGERVQFDAHRRRKGGTVVEVSSTVSPIRDRSGAIVGVSAITRDISEKRRAEDALRETTSALGAIVESSPLGIGAIDVEGRLTMWNPAAERMFGWSAEEVIGFPSPIVPASEVERVERTNRAVLAGETLVDVETVRARKDGSTIQVNVSYAPLCDANSEQIGVIAVFADISERKRSERALEESLEALTKANRHRQELLAKLVRAQEDERQRIASDIHDDSVQVLSALALRLELLRRRHSDAETVFLIQEIEETARLSLSRLRRLMFELRPPELDRDGLEAALRLYLDQTCEEVSLEYSLETRLDAEPDPNARAMIYRITQEALTNVRKHAQASRVDVLLESRHDGLLVRVVDDGKGLAEGVDVERPGHFGLVTMRERAEMAGGWWNLDSNPAGTVVEFLVPAHA